MLLSEERHIGCHLGCHSGCRFHTITAFKVQEPVNLEDKNMAVIEKVYQRLKDDKEVQAHIHQIQAHPWVRVVEGET